jgi:hypothetical protein
VTDNALLNTNQAIKTYPKPVYDFITLTVEPSSEMLPLLAEVLDING